MSAILFCVAGLFAGASNRQVLEALGPIFIVAVLLFIAGLQGVALMAKKMKPKTKKGC